MSPELRLFIAGCLLVVLVLLHRRVEWKQFVQSILTKEIPKDESVLLHGIQRRQREMQRAKMAPMSREWRTEKRRIH